MEGKRLWRPYLVTLAISVITGAVGVPAQAPVALQPLAQHVRRIETALSYLGEPLSPEDQGRINAVLGSADEAAAVRLIEQTLDKYALAVVEINPESRVKVRPGAAKPELVESGTRIFLVKVINQAGVTSRLVVDSPNSLPVYIQSNNSPEPPSKMTAADVRERWADISFYDKDPLSERLSGLGLEYRILQVYSHERGQRSASISFNVGQGTQDIGFRNDMAVLFDALPAHAVRLRVRDEQGEPSVAAFTIRDGQARLYPNPSKRLAPDLFFQPQIYRADGDKVLLPEGTYTVTCSMGPEYFPVSKQLVVPKGDSGAPIELAFRVPRWINPAGYKWYSGDHHVHAAGCSHYQNPSEGVPPETMIRQIQGEKLNVGAVLTWGPCYYHQKKHFSGKDDPNSKHNQLMHYDLEVSGFPSSHAGHLVLLGLVDQDYPGTKRIEDWPTWDLPILHWGAKQGAVVGFAHSGWGLGVKTSELPNYEIPGFDGVGANEYIVDVTYPNAVDFISTMDTPYTWELNIWYHTLNVGFRTRVSGETDFPCITDARVGQGRVYAKVDGPLTYQGWLAAVRNGRSYVSEGRSHLMDFSVNGAEVGAKNGEISLTRGATLHVTVKAAAYLDPLGVANRATRNEDQPPDWVVGSPRIAKGNPLLATPDGALRERPYDEKPYWHIERARIGNTREVPVEVVVNGKAVARKQIVADGHVQDLGFDVPIERSSWVAVRIPASSHTNPLFVLVDGKPIRASRQSAEWCLAAVNQCWTQKAGKISAAELPEAKKAYDHAREVYGRLIQESTQ
jgi:hypothetical protein